MRTLDAHVHVWELARRPQPWIDPVTMAVIDRDHSVAELEIELRDAGVDGAVLVQVLNRADESDELMWAGRSAAVDAVVGWADLLDPRVAVRLDDLVAHSSGTRLCGVRHQAQAEADPAGWLERASAGPGFGALAERGLAFDLMFRPEQLAAVAAAVRAHPATTFVLDHAGKPPVRDGWSSATSRDWAASVARLAGLENLVAKLSGLTTMADLEHWTTADLEPWVETVLTCFGPERVLFGSDWPVSRRAGDYGRTVAAAHALVAALSPSEQEAVLSGTARRAYRLPERVGP